MVIDDGTTEWNPVVILRKFIAGVFNRMHQDNSETMTLRVAITSDQYHVFDIVYRGRESMETPSIANQTDQP